MPPFEKVCKTGNFMTEDDTDVNWGQEYEETEKDKEEYIPSCEED